MDDRLDRLEAEVRGLHIALQIALAAAKDDEYVSAALMRQEATMRRANAHTTTIETIRHYREMFEQKPSAG